MLNSGPGTISLGTRERDYARVTWPCTYSHHPGSGEWFLVTPVGNIVAVRNSEVIRHTDGSITLRNDLVACEGRDEHGSPINEWAGTLRAGVWTQTWGM